MIYNLLSTVNDRVNQQEEFVATIQEAIDFLEFDRSVVICTENEFAAFLKTTKHTILEASDAAMGRAAELDWVNTMRQDREDRGMEKTGTRLGMEKPKARPEQGQVVLTPRGLAKIIEIRPDTGLVTVRGPNVSMTFDAVKLVGPKMVNGKPTWMIGK